VVSDWCSWFSRFAFGVCAVMKKKKNNDILDIVVISLIAVFGMVLFVRFF